MTSVTILGAGIAGLASGWLLKQRGIDFVVLELRSYPGGLARSFEWKGFYCDFAAHRLFTNDEDILHQLLNLVPMGRQIRRSQIYLNGGWMRDPLDTIELARHLPISKSLEMLWYYAIRPRQLDDSSFENYVLRRYGKSLYHLFFQPYTEKLFGISGNEISVLWAQQKVRLANPLDNLRENTKTKFQYFYYPVRGGYGAIANHLYEEIHENVILNARVTNILTNQDRISGVQYEREEESHRISCDTLISTLPLSLTTRMLGHTLDLSFQKVDSVYLHVNKPYVSDNHWFYFMDADIAINRMVEFKNMSPVDTPQGTTVLCAEVTQQHEDPVSKVIKDLERVGLVQPEEILDTKVVHEKFAYPVYSQQYEQILAEAEEIIAKYKNLYIAGRAAEFRHREVDDNFAAAQQTVERILQEFAPDLMIKESAEREPQIMKEPRIFVVILTFNNYKDTQECLQSLENCETEPIQIVLVDNGSEDGTPEKVRQDFPQVHVIENNQNLGVPAGYNVGFRYALENGADYILMLNNDTIIAPNMVSMLLEQAETDPNCGIVMPKVLYYGSDDEIWSSGGRYRRFPPAILYTDRRVDQLKEAVRMIEYAPSCGLLIHRRAFDKAGLFDPGYFFLFDDWDFSERVRAHGLHIWFVRDAIMWHKVSRTTKGPRSALFWYTQGASTARFYRRHGQPVWLSLPIHLGYIILREFILKGNWKFWPDFWRGVQEGLQKPLGSIPEMP